MSLEGKHIVLGISGGIAAYKSAVLTRLLVKAGAEVQVIMTPNAKEFITPVTLSTLSGKPVISEFFSANTGEWHSHVSLGMWADAFVVAPATASTLAKMASGVADNMLVTSYLSTRAKCFVAPAMDFDMMAHPTTSRNLAALVADGVEVIEAQCGELASHLYGKGRMAEPEQIVEAIDSWFDNKAGRNCPQFLAGKKVLVNAGPTREKIDPVRYISNYSTGKMGIAIARQARRQGAEVTLVLGPVSESVAPEQGLRIVNVESAQQMHDCCVEAFADADIAILTAAVADYRVANVASRKIKREGNEPPQLVLEKNPDIAAALGKSKRPGQCVVGFALETDNELANARKKLVSKGLDFVVLNSLADAGSGFGTDTNKVTVIGADGGEVSLPLESKAQVAADIISIILQYMPLSL